jgi:hypothetical protein
LAASRLDPAAAVVCGRGARVNTCAQAPSDYRSTVMLCGWSRPGRQALRVDAGRLPGPRADHNEIAEVVDDCLREGLPIQLVLPAVPFKDQNPFRTSCNASHWDTGERFLLFDYIASLLASISSTLTMGSAFALSISSISVR